MVKITLDELVEYDEPMSFRLYYGDDRGFIGSMIATTFNKTEFVHALFPYDEQPKSHGDYLRRALTKVSDNEKDFSHAYVNIRGQIFVYYAGTSALYSVPAGSRLRV